MPGIDKSIVQRWIPNRNLFGGLILDIHRWQMRTGTRRYTRTLTPASARRAKRVDVAHVTTEER